MRQKNRKFQFLQKSIRGLKIKIWSVTIGLGVPEYKFSCIYHDSEANLESLYILKFAYKIGHFSTKTTFPVEYSEGVEISTQKLLF